MGNLPSTLSSIAGHVKAEADKSYLFASEAVEIRLLDGRGKTLWSQKHIPGGGPIRWNGRDLAGYAMEAGSYTCKITYAGQEPIYLPFVFMR